MTSESRIAHDALGDALADAAHRVTRAVDRLHGDDWQAPSLLPGWTRAHLVAHLGLNAEALAGIIQGVLADEPVPMYASDEARDDDIADLARADHSEIRDRLLGATTVLDDAFRAVPEASWDTRVERTPGGRVMRMSSLPSMRLRELEIHHVDLDAGYTRADWSPEFAELLLDAMAKRTPSEAFEVKPLGSTRTWLVGSHDSDAEHPVPVVTGPAPDLGWWLTGRPAPETLSCSRGELPEIGAW